MQKDLGSQLSRTASLYFPGSSGFDNGTSRWNAYGEPKNISVVVEPGVDEDVAVTVKYANTFNLPFLAVNRGHGSTETLARFQNGIEIHINVLNSISINSDGNSALIGGGIYNDEIIEYLWDHGKASSTGSCGCVGMMGAGLGGGHGRYQGFYGLIADNIIDANVVLANGSQVNVSETSHPDLFWGLRGAGHNYGVVTRFNYKIYDYPVADWFYVSFIFNQEKLEQIFEQVNAMMGNGTQPKELMNFVFYAWDAPTSTTEPVIKVTIYYIGTQDQAARYVTPYHALGPISFQEDTVPYPDVASSTGTGTDDFFCAFGYNRIQFPIGLEVYNITSNRAAYEYYAQVTRDNPALNSSLVLFEGYSVEGVKAVNAASTAYPHRTDNILVAILGTYRPNPSLDDTAIAWSKGTRDMLYAGEPGRELTVYVNYAFGNESLESMYGYEPWRLDKLRSLKTMYDPNGRFGYYNPITQ
ncbi:hypothetical protein MMC13_007584 [Lambiella insularis]|nr:hypothetical protein [Lambiella insularis]